MRQKTFLHAQESPSGSDANDKAQHAGRPPSPGMYLWIVGIVALIAASVVVHFHPGPWPVDLQTTIFIQHVQIWPWVFWFLNFVSVLNNPLPSTITLLIWLVVLSLLRFVRAGLFLAFGTVIADGIDGLLSTLVARPRPHSPLIHVYMPEPFHSFPSGHTEHDIVYYGFLLYLSMTDTVRQWRYRWVLLPFQIFAVVAILAIGYSRIWEGSHWLTDVIGGYLSGAVLLYLLIMLYRRAGVWWERRQARKHKEQAPVTQQVRTT